ncbi:MAG: ribosome recycling factor [Propionibacteriaceae bacterium]|nr:ribosome recycling factor [Propionibacteriaceae bacterium]
MIPDIIAAAEKKMVQAVEFAKEEFTTIRTGRAHPAMFNKLTADYYGQPTPLQQLATFASPEPRTMIITPYDQGAVKAVERAIRNSDLGVNPAVDGRAIRVVLPELTEERRREYTKLARTKAEESRVAIRNIRRHANDSVHRLVKDKEASEDEARGAEKKLDAATKKHIDQVDDILRRKEAELLEV